MRPRRTSIDIIAEILKLRMAGKTQILYRARLGHTQLEKYLHFLVENEFLRVERKANSVKYSTTDRGSRLLSDINRIQTMMDGDREELTLRERLSPLERAAATDAGRQPPRR